MRPALVSSCVIDTRCCATGVFVSDSSQCDIRSFFCFKGATHSLLRPKRGLISQQGKCDETSSFWQVLLGTTWSTATRRLPFVIHFPRNRSLYVSNLPFSVKSNRESEFLLVIYLSWFICLINTLQKLPGSFTGNRIEACAEVKGRTHEVLGLLLQLVQFIHRHWC